MNTVIWLDGSSLWVRLAWLSLATLSIACGDDDTPHGDAGVDAAVSDAEVAGDAAVALDASAGPFGPCVANLDCPDGTFCDREITGNVPVSGAPSGMIDQALFPGGSCTPKPLAPFDSAAACDSSLPQPVQGCGSQGACVLESLNDETYAACRPACEPSATTSGCLRDGYTCDFGIQACVEGCRSDAECRVIVQDSNGDGAPDTLAYDAVSMAFCDVDTRRCAHPGSASVPVGSGCERLDDCAVGGTCLGGANALAGLDFPGGYCSAAGCDVKGRECQGEDTVCETIRPWLGVGTSASMCMVSCEVGAEPESLQTGARSHGVGCREGYRCHYNGGEGAADGVCVGGVYNDVTNNNVGAACTTDAECYSPYGHGHCLQYTATQARIRTPSGACTILDCAAPGLPDGICGSGNECLPFTADLTFCIRNCTTAADCAAGYACADEDQDPATPNICFAACARDADCRGNERCQVARGATSGRCLAMGTSSG